MRVPFNEVRGCLERLLADLGFDPLRAELAARLFAEASLDGVPSHGLDRVPRFVRQVKAGLVDPAAEAVPVERRGAWERWNGMRGAGNLNAWACTEHAITLAREHGIGCVGLSNTNHWMRGGAYGWQAGSSGCALIAWTNTIPNMAPWGAAAATVGNNPLVVAVPGGPGGPVVADMAMSQYSFGRLEGMSRAGQSAPVPAGWDEHGNLSGDPAAVLATGRVVPAGFWKGSALAVVLDLLAVACSGGLATRDLPTDPELESGVSQVFIAVDVGRSATSGDTSRRIAAVIDELVATPALDPDSPVRYPGERVLRARRENLALGVPVDDGVWREILASRR